MYSIQQHGSDGHCRYSEWMQHAMQLSLQHDGEAELIPLLPLLAETVGVGRRPTYLQSLN